MELSNPRKALNKAFLKLKPNGAEIEIFKANLIQVLDRSNETESEEFHKNLVSDFLKKTYYDPKHFINTKGRNDLVIHNGDKATSSVGVIIEAKKPTNKSEMMTKEALNKKALQELLLYYLRERITQKNLEVRHLIATNINEWFIFDAMTFDRLFAQNKELVRQFNDFEAGRLADTKTDFFYKQIAESFITDTKKEIVFTYFNLQDYQKILRSGDSEDENKLIALFKLLSPEHLLKLPFVNDSNNLDKRFYSELLHIIGLTETKQGSKKLIERNKVGERQTGSILEDTIIQLESLDKINRLEHPSQFGNSAEERLFHVALELSITWINRILFLKLLEGQLISYHKGDKSYAFLNLDKIKNYDALNGLFFQVLARKHAERNRDVIEDSAFEKVPYLNSSLFEPTEIEQATLFISNLNADKSIPILSQSVLKDQQGRKRSGKLNTLEYLFAFLDAYDFSSEGSEEIQEENKSLINASVLGLIFEKINGYKDGSFFTPGFITMYMCRETIRKAVVQKFNEAKNWNCKDLYELYNEIGTKTEDRKEANQIINSLKICDPAVGSGHFLVSALNEIIAIKNDLRILQDRNGKRLKEYSVEVVNDELIITDEDGTLFDYKPQSKESQRIQETLFHEKQSIIENCLFGVDINPNSVKICRLRLWIELLKNAYYKSPTELETLPNIDINIKCGNSLISRFALDADLSRALKKSKWSIDAYCLAVETYRNAKDREQKRKMEELIAKIKSDFRAEIEHDDPKVQKLGKLKGKLLQVAHQGEFFNVSKEEKAAKKEQISKLTENIQKLEAEIEKIRTNKIYENAFEWRFEFPEVLNGNGDFVGFDIMIGNPPYIRHEELKEYKNQFKSTFATYSGTTDIYVFFIERGFSIIRKEGLFTYIMPNKFMQAGYGKLVRKFLLEQNLIEIIDFGDLQVFEEATTYPCILLAQKSEPSSTLLTLPITTLNYQDGFSSYVNLAKRKIKQESLSDETWVVSNAADQALLDRLKSISKPLHEFLSGEANYGIKTGLSDAFFIDEKTKQNLLKKDPKSIDIIKPLLRGQSIKPWYSKSENSYLIGTFPSLKLDIDNLGAIKGHLESFGKKRLEQSGKKGSRKKTSGKWFETQDSIAYWKEFEKPKIMYQVFQVKPCFIYDSDKLFCNNSMWILPTDDLVLLGILNSRMGWWLISKYCTQIQNGYQLIWKYFSQIPIATGNDKLREKIENFVTQIINLKKTDPTADTTDLENEINQLVYQLYNLSEEEISIVEDSIK